VTEEKVRENRLRRVAARRGLRLAKSRRRDERALDFGRYWLIDNRTGTVIAGGQWGVSLDEIEEELSGQQRRQVSGPVGAGTPPGQRDLTTPF
jgi:hypothetical protein